MQMGFREGVWTAWRPSRTSNDSICGGAHPSKGAKGGAARWEYHVENFFGMVRLGCMQILFRYL